MSIDEIKKQILQLPGNRFTRAWSTIERITTLLDSADADALLIITYCKLAREAKVMAEATFATTPS